MIFNADVLLFEKIHQKNQFTKQRNLAVIIILSKGSLVSKELISEFSVLACR